MRVGWGKIAIYLPKSKTQQQPIVLLPIIQDATMAGPHPGIQTIGIPPLMHSLIELLQTSQLYTPVILKEQIHNNQLHESAWRILMFVHQLYFPFHSITIDVNNLNISGS